MIFFFFHQKSSHAKADGPETGTLQEKQSGTNPVLIRITTNQGHGASGSSLKKDLESMKDILSFMFYNMGIVPQQ